MAASNSTMTSMRDESKVEGPIRLENTITFDFQINRMYKLCYTNHIILVDTSYNFFICNSLTLECLGRGSAPGIIHEIIELSHSRILILLPFSSLIYQFDASRNNLTYIHNEECQKITANRRVKSLCGGNYLLIYNKVGKFLSIYSSETF